MMVEHLRFEYLLGVDESYRAAPPTAELINDMSLDSLGAWRQSPGYFSIFRYNPSATEAGGAGDPFVGTVDYIETLHWFSQHNGGRQFLVWEEKPTTESYAILKYLDGRNRDRTTIATNRKYIDAPWCKTSYMAHAGWLYFLNGYDQPSRWKDPAFAPTRVGFDRLPASPVLSGPDVYSQVIDWALTDDPLDDAIADRSLASENSPEARGLGDIPASYDSNVAPAVFKRWMHGYAVTWVSDLGQESPPSIIRYVNGRNKGLNTWGGAAYWTGGGKTGVVVEVADAPPNVRGMRVWRTGNLDGVAPNSSLYNVLYLHTEVPSGKGFILHDLKPDDELGRALDDGTLGLFPTGAKQMVTFKNTGFVYGMPEYPDTVQFSAPGFIEQYPEANRLLIGGQDAGEVTGMYPFRNALVVFKRRGVYLVKGDGVSGFYSQTLTEDVGCASPHAICEVPGEGLLFVSDAGIYLLEGALENTGTPTVIRHVGRPVQRTWDRKVNKSALIGACAAVCHKTKEVFIQVPTWAGHRPNFGFVYHYEQKQWSFRDGWGIGAMVESKDHRGEFFLGSNNTGKPGVQVYTWGCTTRTGTALATEYRSSWLSVGGPHERFQVLGLEPYLLGYGDRSVSLNFKVDRRVDFDLATAESRNALDTEKSREKWGTATWAAASTWTDYDLVPIAFPVRHSSSPLEFQYKLTASRMRLVGMDVAIPKRQTPQVGKFDSALGGDRR